MCPMSRPVHKTKCGPDRREEKCRRSLIQGLAWGEGAGWSGGWGRSRGGARPLWPGVSGSAPEPTRANACPSRPRWAPLRLAAPDPRPLAQSGKEGAFQVSPSARGLFGGQVAG